MPKSHSKLIFAKLLPSLISINFKVVKIINWAEILEMNKLNMSEIGYDQALRFSELEPFL